LTAGAWNRPLFRWRLGKAQQLAEGGGSGMMQGGTQGHFQRFQVGPAGLFALGEDARQQCGYFARTAAGVGKASVTVLPRHL
jgi:hypothetical protein